MSRGGTPQTAVQGVALGSVLNVLSKGLMYVRHMLITTWFGLSTSLDAYFIATTLIAIFINTFSDVFDSIGLPSLVKTKEKEGATSFTALTGAMFSFAVLLGGGLTVLLLAFLPLASLMVPGFPRESRHLVDENVLYLLGYALVFLPYHCLGSFFRSVRAFHAYYLAEVLVSVVAVSMLVLLRGDIRSVPVSLSVAYAVGTAALAWAARTRFRFRGAVGGTGEMEVVRARTLRMVPIYVVAYGMVIVDRHFASYLEPGAISALFYAYLLATIVPTIMSIDTVFMTPLSEESDRGALLTRIVSGIWTVSLPVVVFVFSFANELVGLLFERGAFTARAAEMTADALRFYVLGLPVLFLWPTCVRTLQVFGRLGRIAGLAAMAVAFNAAFNLLFFAMGLGVKGVALATALATIVPAMAALRAIASAGVRVRFGELAQIFPNTVLAAAVAAATAIPLSRSGAPVLLTGTLFLVVYGTVAFVVLPGPEMRRVRGIVLESFPSVGRAIGRFL